MAQRMKLISIFVSPFVCSCWAMVTCGWMGGNARLSLEKSGRNMKRKKREENEWNTIKLERFHWEDNGAMECSTCVGDDDDVACLRKELLWTARKGLLPIGC